MYKNVHNYTIPVQTTTNTPQNDIEKVVFKHKFSTSQPPYFCTFIAITSEEIGYNCTIIAINVQLYGISSDKLRKNATKKRKVYRIYSKYIYLLLHLLYREKQDFLRILKGEEKRKVAPKENRKPTKRKLLAGLHLFRGFTKKGQKPFPFCRWYTAVWFLSRLTILNITIERFGISSGSIFTSRAITSSTLLNPTSVSSATFCPLW